MRRTIEVETTDFRPLVNYINDTYLGDLPQLTDHLNQAIYLLHYISETDAAKEDIQNLAFNLRSLSDHLQTCYLEQRKEN